jgi:hypothetical protein
MATRKLIAAALRGIPFALLLIMSDAKAAWLHLCPQAQPADGTVSALFHLPNGEQQHLIVNDEHSRAGCRSIALPVPAQAIAAIRALPAALAASISNDVILDGSERQGQFVIGAVSNGTKSQAPAQARIAAPLRANLLHGMQLRAFGVEERAHAALADGRLTLQCRAGKRPAGVVLNVHWHLPQASLQLELHAEGTGKFDALLADTALAAGDTAYRIGTLSATPRLHALALPLPGKGFDRSSWQSVTIACPNEASQLRLDGLRLLPQPSGSTPPRASWVWNADAWQQQPDEVIARATRYGIRLLFISIPANAGKVAAPEKLASFIERAAAHGIAVWSVDGDPHMVLPQEQSAAVRRVRAYAAFNATHPATRIGGLQFDVEPYLLPGYDNASGEWEARYLDLARALHRAAGSLPLEFVVPFWWGDKAALLDRLAPYASGLSVMDYRTDAAEILRFGAPFLDWGNSHRKQVRIALESGPVEAESRRRYVKATSGELWLIQADRTKLLLLLKEAQPNPAGPAFRLAGSTLSDVCATSFMGDAARLKKLLPELESDFSAWDSFAGLALHEVR